MIKIILQFLVLTAIFSGIAGAQVINAPSNLEAEPEEFSYIKVKWDDNSNNEQGFYIERSYTGDTSVAWETIGSAGQNADRFLDYWVTNNVRYYYRVYAYAGNLRSDYSNIADTIAIIDTANIPLAPSNLILTDSTPTSITIEWQDNSDNELGFIIARREEGQMLFQYIDTVGLDILTYQEVGLTPDNVYYYKVCSYNTFGLSDFTNTVAGRTAKSTNIVSQNVKIPEGYFLGDNFPNPFNPSTNIKFSITEKSFVKLVIYNSSGKEVDRLLNQSLLAGTYQLKWNAENQTSGVYFYRIETENFSAIKKMILIK
ncbi:MAG: T9SS type A sorting domain-containing protein [Ignavibacteria bacterium]|nr:T9SS type A sorting domain-containing protein [Ignavibacteria bacterium]